MTGYAIDYDGNHATVTVGTFGQKVGATILIDAIERDGEVCASVMARATDRLGHNDGARVKSLAMRAFAEISSRRGKPTGAADDREAKMSANRSGGGAR